MSLRMTDELLVGESTGFPCVDSSRDLDDPARCFNLKCILLFWKGDYPGQGMISGFSHASNGGFQCHWCKHPSPYFLKGRALLHCTCQHLPQGHHMRDRPAHGLAGQNTTPFAEYPPPEARTHDETVQQMHVSQAFLHAPDHLGRIQDKKTKGFPGKKTGVNGWCPFVLLHLFDIIKDITLDIMHMLKNWYAKHLLQVLKSNRPVKEPALQEKVAKDSKATIATKKRKDRERRARWQRAGTVSITLFACFVHVCVPLQLMHYLYVRCKHSAPWAKATWAKSIGDAGSYAPRSKAGYIPARALWSTLGSSNAILGWPCPVTQCPTYSTASTFAPRRTDRPQIKRM
jgi:hypothetical protein